MPLARQVDDVLGRSDTFNRPDTDDLRALRRRRLLRAFSVLAAEGQPITTVHELNAEHGKVLIAAWMARGHRPSTVRSQWSVLRSFARAVGKPELDVPLERLCSPQQGVPATSLRPLQRPPRHADLALARALRESRDPTFYYVERLCHLLRISAREALTATIDGLAENAKRCTGGRESHPEIAETQEARELGSLMLEITAFLLRERRRTLRWADLTIPRAMRKHENHVAYLRRRGLNADA